MTEAVSAAQTSGERANFGQRLAAYLIDIVLLYVVIGIIWALTDQNVANIVGLVLGLAYFSYFEGGETGQTLGKRALGIRVSDARSAGPIGFGRALIRYVARIISSIPCLLGYLWMLWDGEKQTWHDKLSSTYVVKAG